jgi:hypothetical protein
MANDRQGRLRTVLCFSSCPSHPVGSCGQAYLSDKAFSSPASPSSHPALRHPALDAGSTPENFSVISNWLEQIVF